MVNEGGDNPKASLEVNVGKEIDAALGDVIRGLLSRPSVALGDLVADGIGILGDRVKLKRQLNAKLGMEEVRKRLDANGVNMKDITPPKEEDLYLLINGMSLADDESVRDMWAGLFAKALEPDSETKAERPYFSILESLSPLDAKIIDLLTYIQRKDSDVKSKMKQFGPKDFKNITPEEKEQAKQIQLENAELLKLAITAVQKKAESYGLSESTAPGWADNLMRLGVIERMPVHQLDNLSALGPMIHDERDLARTIGEFHKKLREMQEISKWQASPPSQVFKQHSFGPQLNLEVRLTDFGKRFATACGIL